MTQSRAQSQFGEILTSYLVNSRQEIKTPDLQFLSHLIRVLSQITNHFIYLFYLTSSPSQLAVRLHGLRSRHLCLI